MLGVEVDTARSGDVIFAGTGEVFGASELLPSLVAASEPLLRISGFFDVTLSVALMSASSAQLLPGVKSDVFNDEGVAVPEAALPCALFADTEGERPLAACAYEKPPVADSVTDPFLREAIVKVL